MKCPKCKNKMKDKSYLLVDLSYVPPNEVKDTFKWVSKYKCKSCGIKIKDGKVK